jgi:hypothetical protein
MPKPQTSTRFHKAQHDRAICLKQNVLKMDDFRRLPGTALGAGALPYGASLDSTI